MSIKRRLMRWLRKSGLLMQADYIRYLIDCVRVRGDNSRIERELPDFRFPPSYLAYDAYSSSSHAWYLESGKRAAGAIWQLLMPWLDRESVPGHGRLVVEWGCGPARIIRHLPGLCCHDDYGFIGTDYKQKTIEWCRENIQGIRFEHNGLNPPLPFDDGSIDALYCISVFTHLSEEMHFAWMKEILRVLRPGGIILMALNGDRFKMALSDAELALYAKGEIVVRGNVLEGSRTYSAYHSPDFVRNKLLNGLDMLAHNTDPDMHISSGQDIWLVRKPLSGTA